MILISELSYIKMASKEDSDGDSKLETAINGQELSNDELYSEIASNFDISKNVNQVGESSTLSNNIGNEEIGSSSVSEDCCIGSAIPYVEYCTDRNAKGEDRKNLVGFNSWYPSGNEPSPTAQDLSVKRSVRPTWISTAPKSARKENYYEMDSITLSKFQTYAAIAQTEFRKGVTYIDTHCHLDLLFNKDGHPGTFKAYREKRKETWAKCYEGCITDFCFPGTFMASDRWKDLLGEGNVYGAFGCHPHEASSYNDDVEKWIIQRMGHDKAVALGEMGLDYSQNNKQDHDVQKRVFRRQLELAVKMNKPLVIHCREAEDDCFEIMKEMVPLNHPIHRHCFLGGFEEAKRWMQFSNLKFGLTTIASYYPERGPLVSLMKQLPLERILIETDTPYFLPRYYTRPDAGKLDWNHPGIGFLTAIRLSVERNVDIEEVLTTIRDNTGILYQI